MVKDVEPYVDKIYIDRNDWKKIERYRHEQCPNSQDQWNINGKFDTRMFFPLNTFILQTQNLKGLVELQDFNPMNFTYTDEIGVLKVKRIEGKGFNIEFNQHDKSKTYHLKGTQENYFNELIVYITSVMIYIIDKAEERRREERISLQVERKQREEYEYKDRELFFLNDIIQYRKIHRNKSSIQYRCECWGVRGHIRHTKHGVQFVHPYKKGKKRDILEPKSKTYLLEHTEGSNLNENETDDKVIT